jgi:hypothetical protein
MQRKKKMEQGPGQGLDWSSLDRQLTAFRPSLPRGVPEKE